MTDLCSKTAVKITAKTKQIFDNITNEYEHYSLIFYPSIQHTYDVAKKINDTWNTAWYQHNHNKIITNIEYNETDEEDVAYYTVTSEYSGFLCSSSEINISNIGSSNSNGIIIEESEMPRTVVNNSTMYEILLIDGFPVFKMSPNNHKINQTDLTLNPSYNINLLSAGNTISYSLNSLNENKFQEIYPKFTPTQRKVDNEIIIDIDPSYIDSYYAKNFFAKIYKITLPPQTSILIFAKTDFFLTPKPGSVKNLFTVTI